MKLNNNEDLVNNLMNYSPYGALGQVFIMEAIQQYAAKVAAADPIPDSAFMHGETWKNVAIDVKTRCDAFYNRHQPEEQA